jgi:hypothetical protein
MSLESLPIGINWVVTHDLVLHAIILIQNDVPTPNVSVPSEKGIKHLILTSNEPV